MLLYHFYIVRCKQNVNMFKLTVFTVGKKVPGWYTTSVEILKCASDGQLLSNMMNVVCSDYIYAKDIHTEQTFGK